MVVDQMERFIRQLTVIKMRKQMTLSITIIWDISSASYATRSLAKPIKIFIARDYKYIIKLMFYKLAQCYSYEAQQCFRYE